MFPCLDDDQAYRWFSPSLSQPAGTLAMKRKLAAILAAHVVGYSRLMEADSSAKENEE